jgi:hypothetical protein
MIDSSHFVASLQNLQTTVLWSAPEIKQIESCCQLNHILDQDIKKKLSYDRHNIAITFTLNV